MEMYNIGDYLITLSEQDLLDITDFLFENSEAQIQINYNEKLGYLSLSVHAKSFIKILSKNHKIIQISDNKFNYPASELYVELQKELIKLISKKEVNV